MTLVPFSKILPSELMSPLALIFRLAVILPVICRESSKLILSPAVTDSKASALTTPLEVIFPATTK